VGRTGAGRGDTNTIRQGRGKVCNFPFKKGSDRKKRGVKLTGDAGLYFTFAKGKGTKCLLLQREKRRNTEAFKT